MMQRIGQAISKLLTYLSLLASIGSFVIAALPLVPSDDPHQTTIDQHAERPEKTDSVAGEHAAEQPPSKQYILWVQRRDRVIKSCLLIIVFCAFALAVIRLTKPR